MNTKKKSYLAFMKMKKIKCILIFLKITLKSFPQREAFYVKEKPYYEVAQKNWVNYLLY